jgi:hypothetical protein
MRAFLGYRSVVNHQHGIDSVERVYFPLSPLAKAAHATLTTTGLHGPISGTDASVRPMQARADASPRRRSADSKRIVTASWDNTARLWEIFAKCALWKC